MLLFLSPPFGWRPGWKDCCCGWLWLDLLAISRTLFSVAVSGVILPIVSDLAGKRKNQAWKEVALLPPLSTGPADPAEADPEGVAQEEHLLLLRVATMLDIHNTFKFVWFVCVYFWSQNVRRLDDSLLPPSRHLWRAGRGGAGKEGPGRLFLSSARVEAWMERLLLRLALAGPVDLLAISRTLCFVAVSGVMLPTAPDLAGKKKSGLERSGPTPSAFRRAGWQLALRERHRRSTRCYAFRRQRSLRLSPPTSGQAQRGRRRGAQLDWEFAFYASCCRLRARTGGAAEGCAAGQGIASYASRRQLRALPDGGGRSWTENWLCTPLAADVRPAGPGLVRRGRRRGAQLDWEFTVCFLCFRRRRRAWPGGRATTEGCAAGQGIAWYFSRRQLRARPGGGGGGAVSLSWTGSLLSTPLAADFGPGPGVAEGCAAGQGIPLHAASRCRLRAWPGGGGSGARCWTEMFLSTARAADFGPGPEGVAGGARCLARGKRRPAPVRSRKTQMMRQDSDGAARLGWGRKSGARLG